MNTVRPFLLLIGRASVFWLGLAGVAFVALVVAGFASPDTRLGTYVDPRFLAAFGFPLVVGWLTGATIQEFQHTSFANGLPGVRRRIGAGFALFGLATSVVVAGIVALSSVGPPGLAVLLIVGLAAFWLGGTLVDPLSSWLTSINVLLVLFAVLFSRDLRVWRQRTWAWPSSSPWRSA